jgi:hypothetical protein
MVKGITQNKPVSEVGGFQASMVPPNSISSVSQAMARFTRPSTCIPSGTSSNAFPGPQRPTPTLVGKRQEGEGILASRKRMGAAGTGTGVKEGKEGNEEQEEKEEKEGREEGNDRNSQFADPLKVRYLRRIQCRCLTILGSRRQCASTAEEETGTPEEGRVSCKSLFLVPHQNSLRP